MKHVSKFLAIVGTGLLLSSFMVSLANPIQIDRHDMDFSHIKFKPLGTPRYTKDYLNEPVLEETYPFNYQYMGIGGLGVNDTNIWDNYQGETKEGKPILVSVIDSGFNIYHEDFIKPEGQGVLLDDKNIEQYSLYHPNSGYFATKFEYNEQTGQVDANTTFYKGIKNAYETFPEGSTSFYSHGTATSACIAASLNGVGSMGLAPKAQILALKVDMQFESIYDAIKYSADQGADVINMSLGAYSKDFIDGNGRQHYGEAKAITILQSAIDYANEKGTIVVASAGNENTDNLSYPASNNKVISVGALERKSGTKKATFSNYNNSLKDRDEIHSTDLTAPGYVYVANANQAPTRDETTPGAVADSYYQETRGTSFSGPLTAGAVALYKAKHPEATYEQVTNALYNSCDDIGYAGYDLVFANGRVNVSKLLQDEVKASNVTPNVTSLTLEGKQDNLYPKYTPTIKFAPTNTSEINKAGYWETSNPDVCLVNKATGEIGAVSKGEADVTFTTFSDANVKAIIHVKVTGLTPNKPASFKADINNLKANELNRILLSSKTYQIDVTNNNGPVFFDSDDKSIATVDSNGLIDLKANGSANIKVTVGTSEYEYPIHVGLDKYLTELKIEKADPNPIKIKFGTFYYPDYQDDFVVKKVYNDNSEEVTTNFEVEGRFPNNHIGYHDVVLSYTEDGITVKTTLKVYVTSEGATPTYLDVPNDTFTTFICDNEHFTEDKDTIIGPNNERWAYEYTKPAEKPTPIEYSPEYKVNEFGNLEDPKTWPKAMTFTLENKFYYGVNSFEMVLYAPGANVSVKVGNNYLKGLNGETVVPGKEFFEGYKFFGTGMGKTVIEITNIQSPIDIQSFEIHVGGKDIATYDAYLHSFRYIEYLMKHNSCSVDWTDRNEIVTLVNEFNFLSQEAKDEFIKQGAIIDKGYETTPFDKLKMIVSQYNKTLQEGEGKLTLILKTDTTTGETLLTYDGDNDSLLMMNNTTLLIGLSLLVAVAILSTTFVIYKRKRL